MSDLIVLTFDNMDEAGRMRESLREVEHRGHLSLDDTAVIVKDAEGKIHVHQLPINQIALVAKLPQILPQLGYSLARIKCHINSIIYV